MPGSQEHTGVPLVNGRSLRVGVVGVGARSSIATIVEMPDNGAKIVAAADPSPFAAERLAAKLGHSVPLVDSVEDLLNQVDVVIVTSPDDTHEEIACAALEAGVAVYLEKPIAITIEGADRVLETAYRTGTKLYVGHNMRHMQVVRIMRDLIQSGEIGEVKTVWTRHFVGNGGDYYFKDWHADRAHSTGLLLQKGAHDIDVMHWLVGSHATEVTAMGDLMVYGEVARREKESRQSGGNPNEAERGELMEQWFSQDHWPPTSLTGLNPVVDVEDVSMVLMRMASGVLGSYEQCHFTPDYWRNYTVIGTAGRIENFGDGEGGVVKLWRHRSGYEPTGDLEIPIHGDNGGHSDADVKTVGEFLRFVAAGTPTETSPLSARESVAAAVSATWSLRNGSVPVAVPEVSPEIRAYFEGNQATR